MYLPRQNSRINPLQSFAGVAGILEDLAGAITRMEGSCSAPTVCRNNNPGNLRAYAAGQPVDSRGIRIFPDFQLGYNALLSQERLNIGKGLTLEEFFGGKPGVYGGYAPSGDSNDPNRYAGNVSSWLGIPRDVPLSQLWGDSNVFGEVGTALPSTSGDAAYSQDPFVWGDAETDDGLSPLAWGALALTVVGLVAATS